MNQPAEAHMMQLNAIIDMAYLKGTKIELETLAVTYL